MPSSGAPLALAARVEDRGGSIPGLAPDGGLAMRPPAEAEPAASINPFGRAAATDAKCPRLAAWRRMTEAVDRVRDRLDKPVDPGIRDTVVALNLLSFPTSPWCTDRARGRTGVG